MTQQLDSHDVNAWRDVDVYQWVLQLGQDGRHSSEVASYASLFLQNNISGKLLLQLSQDDLHRLGIASVGHVMDVHVSACVLVL